MKGLTKIQLHKLTDSVTLMYVCVCINIACWCTGIIHSWMIFETNWRVFVADMCSPPRRVFHLERAGGKCFTNIFV